MGRDMTWARVVETGSGAIAFRLMILGHPYEFVSDAALVGETTHGRWRLGGLRASSIMWSESLDPAQCKLSARGFTAEIVEDGAHRTGDSFAQQPSGVYYLASSMTVGTSTMVLSDAGPADGSVLYVGSECVLVTAGGTTTSLTVTRAYRDTLATAHIVDTTTGITRPEVTSSRPSIEGTVAKLYAYGDGETGDGTLVWRGIVATAPKLRGLTTWEIGLDSVASILEQPLSADLQDPVTLRGIMYNEASGPSFQVIMTTTASEFGDIEDFATITVPESSYETQDDFIQYVNTEIRAQTSAWAFPLNATSGAAPTLSAVAAAGSWGLVYTTTAADPRFVLVHSSTSAIPSVDPLFGDVVGRLLGTSGERVSTVLASTSYAVG
ncbi:MAG: hypothetical protein NUW08_03705, partial [Candidatus Uhrbacteria bacterium]|nr:hypothetical protein [Candidatus Uhrbacteria bacterium]